MKTFKFLLLPILVTLLHYVTLQAQDGTRIQPDKACINCDTPAGSAVLEIKSTEKGILIPRLTSTQRTAINMLTSPANGLLVFDTDTNSFWYFSTTWKEIEISGMVSSSIADTDGDTQIQTEESADEDIIRFDIEGTERWVMTGDRLEPKNSLNNTAIGTSALKEITTGERNTAVGHSALQFETTGKWNVGIGYETLNENSSGDQNTALGYRALKNNTTGKENVSIGSLSLFGNETGRTNVAIGSASLNQNLSGSFNVAVGPSSLQGNTSGDQNTAVGNQSLFSNTEGNRNIGLGYRANFNNKKGDDNTILGYRAGFSSTAHDKSGNVFIGYEAGFNDTTDNKLYIENSNSSSPLIYGDFANDTLRVNGTLDINNAFHFPISDGSAGQVLSTDGVGNITWTNCSSDEIVDADGDTKIQVEESANEDIIRFDLTGTEHLVIEKGTHSNFILSFLNNDNNIFIGKDAGKENDGASGNIAIGQGTLTENMHTYDNVAIGDSSLHRNGMNPNLCFLPNENTAIGAKAMYSNEDGENNTAIGVKSLYSNNDGQFNTAIGAKAMFANSGGRENTAIGAWALGANFLGDYNVGIGYRANDKNENGQKNTIIGYEAGKGNSTHNKSGNIFLGYQAGYNDITDNKLYIENSNSSTPLIYGDFANDTLRVNGTFDINNAFYFPTTDGTSGQYLTTNGSGVLTWTTPSLVGANPNELTESTSNPSTQIRELKNVNTLLRKELLEVKEDYNNVLTELTDIKIMIAQLQGCCVQNTEAPNHSIEIELANAQQLDLPYLEQNAPNPFYEQTIIKYYLPEKFEKAEMRFVNLQGQIIKTVQLRNNGLGTISISAKELTPATYTYSLILDGQLIDTKKMILTK